MISYFFIDRPIFATVLSIVVVLAGGVAFQALPVALYPEIAPPTIQVTASYPGANAQIVQDTVAAPLEQQVNGVENMLYMSSQSTNDGAYTLTVTFNLDTDLNMAQVLVQNRVALAMPQMPALVQSQGVSVKKKSPSTMMIVNLVAEKGAKNVTELEISNYATIQIRDQLARLSGVGDVTYIGQRDYSMRIWLDPEKLSARGLSANDVINAIKEQNVQVAAGQIGQPPAPRGQSFQYPITTKGRLVDKEEFENIILKIGKTPGDPQSVSVLRLRHVGRVELGAQQYDQKCWFNDQPSVALSIFQLPGSNAVKTADTVREKMNKDIKPGLQANGLKFEIAYNTTPFIDESIADVKNALRDAIILVALVVLVFLQNWRATLIPLAAVPVAIIGTFAAMLALGFSLNTLTLFGVVLAVGIVVDDAIVVVENVERWLAAGLPPREAARKAMDEVTGPVVAVALVLCAVFVPCGVPGRNHGPVLPAIRRDYRCLDSALGVQLADAEPGPGGAAAAAARGQERPIYPVAEPGVGLVLLVVQPRLRQGYDCLRVGGGQVVAAEFGGAAALRRSAGSHVLCLRASAGGVHSRGRQGLPPGQRAAARLRLHPAHGGFYVRPAKDCPQGGGR